jgi:hypothetical protein
MRIERLNSKSDIIYSRISFAFGKRATTTDRGAERIWVTHKKRAQEKNRFFSDIKSSEMKAKETLI